MATKTESTASLHPVGPADGAPLPERAGRGRKRFLVLAAFVGSLLAAIAVYAVVTRNQETTDDAQIEADVVPIAARVAGQVARLLVRENQLVKKGDLLLVLDDADFAARLDQAKAELATAQAQVDVAAAQEEVASATATGGLRAAKAQVSGSSMAVAGADAQVAAAKAAVERAEAEVRRSEMEIARAKELRQANAAPQERLDNAQSAYESAQAALAQARAGFSAAEEGRHAAQSHVAEAEGRLAQSSPIEAQIASAHAATQLARARLAVSQAAVRLSELQLSYTRVQAPDDGVVSKVTVREGQLIALGQPLAELVPRRTYVVANFKETQLERMRPGDHAKIVVDAFPDRPLTGRVESLSAGTGARFSLMPPDNASGNFVKVVQRVPVRIAWDGPATDLPLQAGLSSTVTVMLQDR